jgi:ABC-type amino acid transport substrate-binding protein
MKHVFVKKYPFSKLAVISKFTLFIFVLLAFTSVKANVKEIRFPNNFNPAEEYILLLLDIILANSDGVKLTLVDNSTTTQARLLKHLDNNRLDLVFMGTNQLREEKYLPIRIPVHRGLLGYRVFLIHKDNIALFKRISDLSSLKKLVACQDNHWPDTKILRDNGYAVTTSSLYNSLFNMLDIGRCDYFPRSIVEAYAEKNIKGAELPNLVVFDDIILHYNMPSYFFLRKGDEETADIIRRGFLLSIEDGRFEAFFQNSDLTKHIYPLNKWENKWYIELSSNLPSLGKDNANIIRLDNLKENK